MVRRMTLKVNIFCNNIYIYIYVNSNVIVDLLINTSKKKNYRRCYAIEKLKGAKEHNSFE